MQGSRPMWTVPGSPDPAAAGSFGGAVTAEVPRYQPEDGLYYLRATSLLHHQAFDVSPEFAVIDHLLLLMLTMTITCCCW